MKHVLLLILIITLTSYSQSILHVPSEYPTIQAGINAASNHDTVLVAPGVYYENIDFSGKNIVLGSNFLFTDDRTYISQTIIDGNQSGSIVSIANGEDSTCVLIGFTLQHGRRGIFCQNSSPIISNCIIKENSFFSHFDGGVGIECFNSSPTILRCAIIENSEISGIFGSGWAINLSSTTEIASPKIINTTIACNEEISGGRIRSINSTPIIINCIIWNNGGVSLLSNQVQPVVVYSDVEGGWAGEGNIDSYPMFSDTLNGDFTLSENSPCIDAGTALYILNGDTILNFPTNTYDGLAPDMGFIESPYPLGINEGLNQPKKFILSQNYPNPFNPTTKIKFTIPSVGTSRYSGTVSVQLKVYDVLGNEVATLVNENKPAGSYEVEFDGTDLISGIYFYRIEAGSFIKTKKMILIK